MNARLAATDLALDAPPTASVTRTMWGIAIVWFIVATALGASGLLVDYALLVGPFIVMPLIVFGLAFAALRRVRAWAFTFDTRTLVVAQTVRGSGGSSSVGWRSASSISWSPSPW
jgi:hypothetical protein